jgi:acetolactate synthase-1/2/3 large subunit
MKVAEAVARFLESQGIKHVFGVNGGANLHLIHGLADVTSIKFIPTTHECNAGFAADAYARLTGLGVAMATSGPGATNLVTAIATSYYDSVPVLYITGNVATFRFGAPLGVRQYGFQETPIVEMVRGITKFAGLCTRAMDVIPCLEAAIHNINEGRRGPALVDLPDDIQRADI